MSALASPDTDVAIEAWLDDEVKCSGLDHEKDPRLHGDPDKPAEYMVEFRCETCGYSDRRPVCAFFALGIGLRKRRVICTECRETEWEQDVFHILWKL